MKQVFFLTLSIAAFSCTALFGDNEKLRKEVERAFTKLAANVDKASRGKVVALLDVSSTAKSELALGVVADIEKSFFEALLARSVRIFPSGIDWTPGYQTKTGLFSKAKFFNSKEPSDLKNRKANLLLLSRTLSRGGKLRIQVELIDLVSKKTVFGTGVPIVRITQASVISSAQFLPPMNVKVLLQAIGNFGKQIDRGECWDLPASALEKTGFRVRGYDFGRKVAWPDALPGDVLTIDNEKYHHVMVLLKPAREKSSAIILHQNWGRKRFVMEMTFPKKYSEDLIVWRPGVRD